MLAIAYLAIAICLGDRLCCRYFPFVSRAHRCAAAILVGLLVSSCFTYVVAWLAARVSRQPLVWGDLVFIAMAVAIIAMDRRRLKRAPQRPTALIHPIPPGSERWDWVTLSVCFAVVTWLMFATFTTKDGSLLIGNNVWSDFGANTAIIQSFAVGHNFPTEYPHFSGEPIRYHFLFYFLAGNLTYLGLNPAWSLNLLSVLSVVSMLALVMALAHLLFDSRAVGRISCALFFFHGSLSFIPFFYSRTSVSGVQSIFGLKEFLPSIFPYRGERWGIWTQVVFLNQRHFASGIGILLLVLLFLIERYRRAGNPHTIADVMPDDQAPLGPPSGISSGIQPANVGGSAGFVFCGFLLGALPYWNALVFISAFAVLACLFVLFPFRRSMILLGTTAALLALPQLLLLQFSGSAGSNRSLLRWGYVLDNPTLLSVIVYLGFHFGIKLFLLDIAVSMASWFHFRLLIATSVLVVLPFVSQLSADVINGHKFLNIWLIIINIFAAYALWRLWGLKPKFLAFAGRRIALVLASAITIGGLLDLLPIHNGYFMAVKYRDDPLIHFLQSNTPPTAIFLSHRYVSHQILLSGRRLFYGHPSFAWASGYNTDKRDEEYRQLFESRDPRVVFRLLKRHQISYVAIDNDVRRGDFIRHCNEGLYAQYCPKIWEDPANRFNSLTIYKVPLDLAPNLVPTTELPQP